MKKTLNGGAAALALLCMATGALAQNPCARPPDVLALRAAGLQQQLMVAALSCDAVVRYNQFVTTYQRELQATDRALQAYFRRLNPRTGTADYHAFKTRLANSSSITSIGDMQKFCDGAKAIFASALDTEKQTLAGFISTQAELTNASYTVCAGPQAQIVAAAVPPDDVPLPWEKPEAATRFWRPPMLFLADSVPAPGLRPSAY